MTDKREELIAEEPPMAGTEFTPGHPMQIVHTVRGEPTDAQQIIVQEVSRLAGMQVLRRYAGFSDQWWDQLYAGIARVVRAAAAVTNQEGEKR